MKKLVAILLVAVMLLSVVACGKTEDPGATPDAPAGPTDPNPYDEITDYEELSEAVYNGVLGEFYEAYTAVKNAGSVSERYALQAIAEAKLMEAAVMLPLTSQGGNYAIGRTAPYTVTSVLWGNDSYRYHDILVCTEPIETAHRNEMKAKWAELKGTGTYESWAKSYLTGKGYTLKDTYTFAYTGDPKTWDVLATSQAVDSEATVNTYDGLVEYDIENELKPALATSWEQGTDAEGRTTFTFKIRQGVNWVDSQGRVVAAVKADDFVAGMQHMMDAMGGLEYLIQGLILNATAYIDGDITDMTEVGVKAVDDTTLVYTLEEGAESSYFMTMLGYGVFAPMSREYYTSQGGRFGVDYDDTADSYTYGKTPNNIAYCGPYLVTNATEKNTIVFQANDAYWNKANIEIKTITWLYNDGEEATKAYTDMKAGTIDSCGLNTSALELAKNDGWFDKYNYVTSTDATSYMAFYNVYRAAYANVNDPTTVVSTQTDEQRARTKAALLNVHFRRALSFATDRKSYNAQSVGDELALASLINCYTPGNFVYLSEEVTVKINGVDTTYAAGTYYGKIMQDQLDADGVKIKVWDPTAEAGVGASSGFDGWYNVTNAVEELNIAITELAAGGIEISAENPIYIDVPYFAASQGYTNRAQAYKQSVESALGSKVIINLVACNVDTEWYYAGYWTETGAEANYDMYDLSGWGPDYGDPQTYLDTFLPDYAGYMVKCIGIY